MGWKTRLTKGLENIGIIDSPPRQIKPPNSLHLMDMKNYFETMPGLSQPVWGPEIATVGAYSREGYTSKTFDTPTIRFRIQAEALEVDEDVQLAVNDLASKITGGEHYVKAKNDALVDYFEKFTKDMRFDTWDTLLVKELLWYGNSIYKPRLGISNVRSFDDLMHIPISSFVRIWWDRQRIPYKYEFRGAEYQGYHNPDEVIHFVWNPIDASAFGTGFGTSMTSPRFFSQVGPNGLFENKLPSLLERKYATQFNMQMAELRYITRNVWQIESGDEDDRSALQSQVENLEIGQDIVAGTKVAVDQLGSQARNFNPQQFQDITMGPIMKALNDFRSKEAGTSQHSYANAKTSAILTEIGLSAFPVSVMEQLNLKFFKPWYEAHPYYDPMYAGGLVPVPWDDTDFEINFGEVEKKDIPLEDQIKLIEMYMQATATGSMQGDPLELRKLFEQAGLGLTKSDSQGYQDMLDQGMTSPMGMTGIAPNIQNIPNIPNTQLPQNDMGGGPLPPQFNNQNVGNPPMDENIYNDMMIDPRGSQNPFKPTNYRRSGQNQDYNYGRNYE